MASVRQLAAAYEAGWSHGANMLALPAVDDVTAEPDVALALWLGNLTGMVHGLGTLHERIGWAGGPNENRQDLDEYAEHIRSAIEEAGPPSSPVEVTPC